MGALAVPLAISLVASAGSAAVGFAQQRQAAGAQAASLRGQENQLRAQRAADKASYESQQSARRRQLSALLGRQRAAFGASGIDPNSGSAEAVATATIDENALQSFAERDQFGRRLAGYDAAQDGIEASQDALSSQVKLLPFASAAQVGSSLASTYAMYSALQPATSPVSLPSATSGLGATRDGGNLYWHNWRL